MSAFCFFLLIQESRAQKPAQIIRGYVYDEISRRPIEGVEVYLQKTEPLKGTSSDAEGKFVLKDVEVGRYIITFKHIGYQPHHEDIVVEAGKPLHLQMNLTPTYNELEGITITDKPFITDLNAVGKRSVTIEQTRRFAANYLDPARVMLSFPGVVPQNDQNNNIIINGKSPNGLLWRVEGMDVLNPNHLANAGTLSDRPTQNGGGVNILSAQMLGKTNFLTAPFGPAYGNVFSGAMEMNFRPGNKQQHHYMAQASLIGLDVAAEGPLKRDRSSFLVNYRYSTVGLLSKMGVDFGGEEIDFQDLSFHMSFDQKKGGRLSVFGYGGNSNNDFGGIDDPQEWEFDKDSTRVDFSSVSGAFGFKEVLPLNKRSSLLFGATFSMIDTKRSSQGLGRDGATIPAEKYELKKGLLSGKMEFKSRISVSSRISAGMMANYSNDKLLAVESYTGRGELINGDGQGLLLQPYVDFGTWLSSQWNIEGGLRYMYFSYNESMALLPFLQLNHHLNEQTLISLSYGNQSQIQSPELYFTDNNKMLDMSRMHHVSLGYNRSFKNTLFSSKIFYETMYSIPVSQGASNSFSAINQLNEYPAGPLVNDGTGEIYGINMSFEKPVNNGFYYIMSGSVFESTYKGSDNIERDTRFNNNYSVSITAGKELTKEKSDAVRITGLDGRLFYAGGMKKTPVSEQLSQNALRTVYVEDQAFSENLGDYFRIDFRLSFRKEKANYTRVLALDIQNLISVENDGFEYYDFRKGEVIMKKQLGIIPILVYRVEF